MIMILGWVVFSLGCAVMVMAVTGATASMICDAIKRRRERCPPPPEVPAFKNEGIWAWHKGAPTCTGFLYARTIPEGFPGCDGCAPWAKILETDTTHPELGADWQPHYLCPRCFEIVLETRRRQGLLSPETGRTVRDMLQGGPESDPPVS